MTGVLITPEENGMLTVNEYWRRVQDQLKDKFSAGILFVVVLFFRTAAEAQMAGRSCGSHSAF